MSKRAPSFQRLSRQQMMFAGLTLAALSLMTMGCPQGRPPTRLLMEPIKAAFDALFETIQTRETESGNIVMFKRGSRSSSVGIGVSEADAVVDAVAKRLSGSSIPVRVVESFHDLPPDVLAAVEAEGVTHGEIKALNYHDNSYILADQMDNAAAVEEVVYHEHYTHGGLRAKCGKDLQAKLTKITAASGGLYSIRRMAKQQDISLRGYEKALSERNNLTADRPEN